MTRVKRSSGSLPGDSMTRFSFFGLSKIYASLPHRSVFRFATSTCHSRHSWHSSHFRAPVAQLDRVCDFGSQGCRFEPCRVQAKRCSAKTSSGLRPRDAGSFLFDLHSWRRCIGGLQLAELFFFLLGLFFDFPLPLFKLIVRFCQFLDPPITTKSPVEAAMASRLSNDPSAAAVCGGIVRFAKRLSLFDLSRCA